MQASWLAGIGCPTGAKTFNGTTTSPFTNLACQTGDSKDQRNQGLLLAKTGPGSTDASASAELRGVKGIKNLTELGYDIRKPLAASDARGSHCATSPRFVITTKTGMQTVSCNALTATATGAGWLRLRWTIGGISDVLAISIVFNDGQDAAPDNFGAAVLDNIDVNGTLVGRSGGDGDEGDGNKDKKDGDKHGDDKDKAKESGDKEHERKDDGDKDKEDDD